MKNGIFEKYVHEKGIEEHKTKVIMRAFAKFNDKGIGSDDFLNMTTEEICQSIKTIAPKTFLTLKDCFSFICVFVRWAEQNGYCKDKSTLLSEINDINKNDFFMSYNQNKKFISKEEFDDALKTIEMMCEFNSLYYKTLLQAIYDGLYDARLIKISKLRKSDIISENEIMVDGVPFEVSKSLITDMEELSKIDVWERKNRYGGVSTINLAGMHMDSIFRIETRVNMTDWEQSNRDFHYRKIRKLNKDGYLPFEMKIKDIYVSGLLDRITIKLKGAGIDPRKVFINKAYDSGANRIIEDELKRCGYELYTVREFKANIRPYFDEIF